MFYNLRGILTLIESNFIVIECSGVGFKCFASAYTQKNLSNMLNNEVNVFTYLNVREDALDLFAFISQDERTCFKYLTSVSGVGAKVGLAILSEFSAEQVAIFISSNDSKSITKVPGVGNKLAQRIILELRDKLKLGKNIPIASTKEMLNISRNVSEAIKALEVLGYSQTDVSPILKKLDQNLSVEELIRLVLKSKIK